MLYRFVSHIIFRLWLAVRACALIQRSCSDSPVVLERVTTWFPSGLWEGTDVNWHNLSYPGNKRHSKNCIMQPLHNTMMQRGLIQYGTIYLELFYESRLSLESREQQLFLSKVPYPWLLINICLRWRGWGGLLLCFAFSKHTSSSSSISVAVILKKKYPHKRQQRRGRGWFGLSFQL